MSDPTDVDLLIVGAGIGGLAAARSAEDAGMTVMIVERSEQVGGNLPVSTGYFAFVDTPMQRAAAISDSVDRFMTDVQAELDRQRSKLPVVFNEALMRRFATESIHGYEFLLSIGIRFDRLIPRPLQHSVTRLHAIRDPAGLRRALDELDVLVRYRSRATRLATEHGRIVGARIESPTGEVTEIRASRAVVLAAGGYQAGLELRHEVQPAHHASVPFGGLDTCTGDGHRMADAVGGHLINMAMIEVHVRGPSVLIEDCIAVDGDGQRFHDEAGPYHLRIAALLELANGTGHYICDSYTAALREDLIRSMPEPPVAARTVAKLAERIGVPPAALESTVSRWNDFLDSGEAKDPDHGRVIMPVDRRPIAEPPFYALRMVPGVATSAGGVKTDTHLRVLDAFGDVIPGLLAVGDCAGGVIPAKGLGGIHLGAAVTLGLAAGRHAATL